MGSIICVILWYNCQLVLSACQIIVITVQCYDQIMFNLIPNLKASTRGGVEINVETRKIFFSAIFLKQKLQTKYKQKEKKSVYEVVFIINSKKSNFLRKISEKFLFSFNFHCFIIVNMKIQENFEGFPLPPTLFEPLILSHSFG